MLENIRGLSNWCHKDYKVIYKLWRRRIVKQYELDGDSKFTTTIDLVENYQVTKRETKDNFENGEEYVGRT